MKTLRTVVLWTIMISTLLSTDLGAQWTPTNGPGGGMVRALGASGTDLYAGVMIAGVFRSTDNGANWTNTSSGLSNLFIQSIGFLGTDVYAGTEGSGIFRSTNNGANWSAANSGIASADVRSIVAKGTDLYAGDYGAGGVFKSTNNGSSWSSTGLTGPSTKVRALIVSGSNIFAGAESGLVYRSTNDGGSWTQKNSGISTNHVKAFAAIGTTLFVGTEGGGVFRSTDDGDSWTAVNSGLNLQVSAMAADGSDLYAGTLDGTGIYKSTDNGDSWTAGSFGVVNMSVASMMACGSGIYAGINGGGVLRSTDNGSTWAAVNDGLMGSWVYALLVNGSNVFAGTFGVGVSRTSDGGANWAVVTSGLTTGAVSSLAAAGSDLFAGTDGNGVFHSTNDGVAWTAVNIGLGNTTIKSLATKSADLFAGTAGGVYRTTDNGGSWSSASTGLTNTNVQVLLVKGTDVFAGTAGGVFRSTNDGGNWSSVSSFTNQNVQSLGTDGTRLYAGTAAGMYRSTDNGANWTDISAGLANTSIKSIATDGTYLFAGTDAGSGGVFRSLDYGSTWSAFSGGLPASDFTNSFALAIDGNTVYSGMVGFGVSKAQKAYGIGQNIDLATASNFNFRIDGASASDFAGTAIAYGDVNGDGFSDVIIGASNTGFNGRSSSGSVYVLYGTAGTTTAILKDLLTSSNYHIRYDGAAASDWFGEKVASGDVNGDGFDDVIVGAYNASNNSRAYSGSVYVIYGASGATTGNIYDLAISTSYNIRLDGASANDYLGGSVACGDVNGDGFDDVIAGASSTGYNSRLSSGSAYVIYGASGSSTGNTRDMAAAANFHIRYSGALAYDYLGRCVASGDINGDGYADLILAATFASNNSRMQSGSVYVIYGAAGSSTGNTRDLSTASNFNLRYDGAAAVDNLGISAASGDVNGDGYADVIIGASGASNNSRSYSGSAYVIYGSAGTSTGNTRDLATAANYNIRHDGASAFASLGDAVASGDVNGDGFDDVIAGARYESNNGRSGSGSVYVINGASGTSSGITRDLATTTSFSIRFDGAVAGDYLTGSTASGDVNGDGFDDVFLGAAGTDYNSRLNSGSTYLVYPVTSGTPSARIRQSPAGDAPAMEWATENASIDFAAGNSGTVSVQQIQTQPSTGDPANTASVSWILATTKTGITGTTVRLRFKDAQVAGLTKADLKMFKRPTGGGPNDWSLVDGSSVNTSTNTVTGVVDGFSEFTIGDESVLPIQMMGLTAEIGGQSSEVTLRWTTATETDNAGWEIERREIANVESSIANWSKVGFVTGAGTSTSPREYAHADTPPTTADGRPGSRYAYRLKQLDRNGASSYSHEVEVEVGSVPREFALQQNYPNPFNPNTTIRFTLAEDARTSLVVYDLLGRQITTLVDDQLKAGVLQQVDFDGANLPSGVYFVQLTSGLRRAVQKLILSK